MKTGSSIYKTDEARMNLMALYEKRLQDLDIEFKEFDVKTFAGKTHIIVTGKVDGPPIVLFHGINAGSPMTLEAVKGLSDEFRLYCVDTIGQTTKSAETRLPLDDDSLAKWLAEVLDALKLKKPNFIGVSYGAFLLQKLMTHFPERIEKGIFIVPAGLVNGGLIPSIRQLTLPLIRFMMTKKDDHLRKFMDAFYDTKGENDFVMQRNTLLGTKMDYRRPPLLTEKDVENLDAPVYAMVADNEVFFPGDKAVEKCRKIFKNFAESHVLKNTKHIPDKSVYPEIESKLREWIHQN